MTTEVVITHGIRTPFAKIGTALRDVPAVELGRQVVAELVARADLDPERVDQLIMGCAGNPIDAANVARVIGLRANLPRGLPAVTVQRNCGSGLESITSAAARIRSGRARVVVAGGRPVGPCGVAGGGGGAGADGGRAAAGGRRGADPDHGRGGLAERGGGVRDRAALVRCAR